MKTPRAGGGDAERRPLSPERLAEIARLYDSSQFGVFVVSISPDAYECRGLLRPTLDEAQQDLGLVSAIPELFAEISHLQGEREVSRSDETSLRTRISALEAGLREACARMEALALDTRRLRSLTEGVHSKENNEDLRAHDRA
jgi:hypothetical protein